MAENTLERQIGTINRLRRDYELVIASDVWERKVPRSLPIRKDTLVTRSFPEEVIERVMEKHGVEITETVLDYTTSMVGKLTSRIYSTEEIHNALVNFVPMASKQLEENPNLDPCDILDELSEDYAKNLDQAWTIPEAKDFIQ